MFAMYRHSAQVNCIPRNAPPSPDNTSDSESEILDALDRKRRQLDEEIARFKAAKDREFREFEKELRINRKRSGGGHQHHHESGSSSKNSASASSTAAALTLLASARNGSANGLTGNKQKRAGEAVGDKIVKQVPLSKATLCLDKMNIPGETLPPLNNLATPPTTSRLIRRSSRTFPPTSISTTPPRSKTDEANPPPTPSSDRTDSFAGVFTPVYLPLLESRDRPPFVRSPQPMSAQEEETKRLQQLDADNKKEAERQKPRLESSQSLPPQPVSPTVIDNKRTKSTGELPSSSLPSALRSSKTGARKGKHVHFQLADFTVVDPSSSYEESSSPALSPGEKEETTTNGGADHGDGNVQSKKGAISLRRKKGSPKHLKLPSDNREKGRGRTGRFLSPMPSPLPSPSPSPTTEGSSSSLLASPDESGFTDGLSQADDGGSGVGFFELDEELASPGFREKPLEQELEVDPFLEDGVVDEKRVGAGDGEVGLGSSFGAGSVPIDIVRPTGSWIGSFGH